MTIATCSAPRSFAPFACQGCGSILDAPRVNPATGDVERKCGDCARWQPLASGRGRAGEVRAPTGRSA